jgi:hypothetical protein
MITASEIGYVPGLSKNISTSFAAKQPVGSYALSTDLLKCLRLDGSTNTLSANVSLGTTSTYKFRGATSTEIGYLSGLPESIATSLAAKQPVGSYALTTDLPKCLRLDGSTNTLTDNVTLVTTSAYKFCGATATEIGYLSGLTQSIATYLNGKQNAGNYALSTDLPKCLRLDGSTNILTANVSFITTSAYKFCGATSTKIGYLSGLTESISSSLN